MEPTENEEVLPSRSNVEKHLAGVLAFMSTPAFSSYLATVRTDLAGIETSILSTPPVSGNDQAAVLIQYGRREELVKQLSFFEDTRDRLEELLDRIVEAEANEDHDNKQNNDETEIQT